MAGFDVFLSHNSEDKEQVRLIAERLRTEGLNPWLDEWQLIPGAAWQKGLTEGVTASTCAAVFIGANGVGSWQDAESMLILNRAFNDSAYRLIPVLLPGSPADAPSAFSAFVTLFTWVDFRSGLDDPRALERLVAGIRGESPSPDRRESPHKARSGRLSDLDRSLTALGVPEGDLQEAAEWLAARVADEEWAPAPENQWPPQLREAVETFEQELQEFAWPERVLGSYFYLSTSKVARMYRANRTQLGADEESAADRFRMLHRFLSDRQRLAFAPSLVLLNEPLPAGDDTWLYFRGDFTIKLSTALFEAVPQAQQIIESADQNNIYNLVARIFGPADPFFLPIVEFEGSIGPHAVTMLMSRKYIGVESMSATALGKALLGESVTLSGFATLNGREVQPIVCRIAGRGW